MHGPATTPDNINAIPEAILATTPNSAARTVNLSDPRRTSSCGKPHIATHATSAGSAANTTAEVRDRAAHNSAKSIHRAFPRLVVRQASRPDEAPATALTSPTTPRSPGQRFGRWLHYAAVNRERGMSTAEYAVGTIAACAFAALLFKVVSSPEVQEMLSSLIDRALNTAGG